MLQEVFPGLACKWTGVGSLSQLLMSVLQGSNGVSSVAPQNNGPQNTSSTWRERHRAGQVARQDSEKRRGPKIVLVTKAVARARRQTQQRGRKGQTSFPWGDVSSMKMNELMQSMRVSLFSGPDPECKAQHVFILQTFCCSHFSIYKRCIIKTRASQFPLKCPHDRGA